MSDENPHKLERGMELQEILNENMQKLYVNIMKKYRKVQYGQQLSNRAVWEIIWHVT